MSIQKAEKSELIKKYSVNEKDNGSVEVQSAILTTRIKNLTEHLKNHKQDHSSRRGLLMLVSRRRSLLSYLKLKSNDRYNSLIKSLGLRK